ncbi:peptidylprolyl isomerase [Nocardioides donggukensis]|uniref:Peptidyl-prolyl cis-trans isomerase n=1 Tax=Nocardioides donggukensis TaxID=2774019 RepID=A0A927K2W4_9ACTN|nr:peptidylprolyl isomerase [Nocardioides donggukensis]MBD8869562.1 peptidylprolyl isomerase [Nocardioides donggukensis]
MLTRALPAAAAALLLLFSACSEDSSDDVTASDAATSEGAESGEAGDTACDYPEDGRPAAKEVSPPPAEPTETGSTEVAIETSVGDIDATLDGAATPCTVNSFLSLAEQDYFDGTDCHRLTEGGLSVLQCGDPTGTGGGGPGYSFEDELTGEESYPAGTLAMANAGPGTNGSQFFIVYGDSQLPPSYTVFGSVDDEAVDLVTEVAKKGSDGSYPDGSGVPNEQVTITDVG